MADREPLDELRSLLGVWYTDSPAWPPAPGVQKALRLLKAVERDHLESLAVYIGQIKELTRELMDARSVRGDLSALQIPGRVSGHKPSAPDGRTVR